MGSVKFGKKSFPNDFPGVRKDAKLFKAFQAYAKGAYISESVAFLTTKFDPKKHYPIFIQNNGSAQVNLAGKVREPMDDLAAANNWNKKVWEKHVVAAKKEVRDMIQRDHLGATISKFWKSLEFQKVLRDDIGKPSKAASLLGISPKNLDTLHDLMVAIAMKDNGKIKKASEDLVKKEKLNFSAKDLAKKAGGLV